MKILEKGPDNNIYVFIQPETLWKFDIIAKHWRKEHINKYYPDLPDDFKGGVRCDKNITWFFRGKL